MLCVQPGSQRNDSSDTAGGREPECGSARSRPRSIDRKGAYKTTPGSLFVIGVKFMNVDVPRLLDQEYTRQRSDG